MKKKMIGLLLAVVMILGTVPFGVIAALPEQESFQTIPGKAATCTENGYVAYYQKSDNYYSDADCTEEITNLENWLNTTVANGGGMLPAKGHTWKWFSDYEHYCTVCSEQEDHTGGDDYICAACGHVIVRTAKSDAIKAINDAAGNSESKAVKALAAAAIADIEDESTNTVALVMALRDEWIAEIEKLTGTTHEHTFEDHYTYNATHHWYACTCGHAVVDGFAAHTFGNGATEGNKTSYTCSVCGYTKYVYNTEGDNEGEIITGVSYTGISLTLGSDIAINFYMDLSDEARQNGTMTFDIGGRIVSLKGTDAKWNSTENKYYFSTPLTALEMAETVKATFTYNGIEYVQEYSVAEYIEKIVGNPGKYGTEAAVLAKKIANYGYYAQIYLASIHESVTIGDDGYAVMEKFGGVDIDVAEATEALANYAVTVSGTSDNLSLYGSTVYFDSATALNYYVTVKNGVKPTATAANTATGETKQVEIKLYKNSIYIVSVKDITATELADDIEVKINNEITLTGSVFAYCNSVVEAHSFDGAAEKDTFAVNAMAAFYEYYAAAVDYAESAKPVYNVVFYMDTHCMNINIKVKSGEKVSRPDDPNDKDYVFIGWYADIDCTIPWDFETVITENTTIYSKWRAKDDFSQYSLCGYINDREYGMTETPIGTDEPYVFSSDGKLTVTFSSYTHVKLRQTDGSEWFYLESDEPYGAASKLRAAPFTSLNEEYAYDLVVFLGRQVTLTLSRDENGDLMLGYEVLPFTVSFNMMGHGTQIPSQTLKLGEVPQIPADPTADGYIFGGWYRDENCTEEYRVGPGLVTDDMELFAKWTPIQ